MIRFGVRSARRRWTRRATRIAATALAVSAAAPASAARLLTPMPAEPMELMLGAKTSRYYRLTTGAPATLSVEGPGTLKLIVRALPENTAMETVPYRFVISEARHTVKEIQTETTPNLLGWRNRSDACTQSRSFHLKIPKGTHEYRLRFKSAAAGAAAVRYVFRASKRSGPQSQIYPSAMSEAVTIVVKETPLSYFVATAETPVTVRAIGPTSLRVVTRLVYPGRARGRRLYTLLLSRDGSPVPDKTLDTRKSMVAECAQHPEWNLGRSHTFYIRVPNDIHEYSFRLSGDYAPAVALRFSIPKEDLQNGR